MLPELNHLLNHLFDVAEQASLAIMDIYAKQRELFIRSKSDQTLVTVADELAHRLLVAELARLTPGIPIISEEGVQIDYAERKSWTDYWLIDPLDGTKEFIDRTGEFSINIALIRDNKPILGLVYLPTTQLCYFATTKAGAYKRSAEGDIQAIKVREKPSVPMITISRRHNPQRLQAIFSNIGPYGLLALGSAWKICQVAEGSADIYPRLGPTSEWDTAAGQCILEEAGGQLINLQGETLRYNTKESLLNPEFIAVGDNYFNWLSYLTI
jgi:3'(2'), 5'-bisphosphate nucleotidase